MAYAFIDRILECEAGERVTAIKALALNEEFFRDHFPGMPVLPGAMILEGFVQAARACLGGAEEEPWVLHEVKGMRFNRFAAPGDVLQLSATREKEPGEEGAVWFKGRATADGESVCRLRFAVRREPSL